MHPLFEDKENALASPTRGSARKMQRALLAARENGDSDEENYGRSSVPIKSLAFDVSGQGESSGTRHTPESKSRSPTRPPKSLLRSPTKSRVEDPREPQKLETFPTARLVSPSPERRSPSPPATFASLLTQSTFFHSESAPRAPLAVLEERPLDEPSAEVHDNEATSWKPEVPSRTVPVPIPIPSLKPEAAVLPPSPMKVDGLSYDRIPDASFRSIPLDSPRASKSPTAPNAELLDVLETAPPLERLATPQSPAPVQISKSAGPPRLSHPRIEKHYSSEEISPSTVR